MAGRIDTRLAELGLTVPNAPAPAANYVPWVVSGGLLFIAGQVPMSDGAVTHTGALGRDADLDHGIAAAKLCALNNIAQMKAALGNLDRVARIVKITVFVNSAADFTDQPKVANGASDFLVSVFGDAGRHARSAVGASALPLNSSVEIESIVEIAPA